jgi:hypothetical protein
MSPKPFRRLFVAIVVLLNVSVAYSRPSPRWTYEMMWSQSDIVIIGAIQATQDCENVDGFFPSHLSCKQSTINIHAVLKGSNEQPTLEFVHFEYKPDVTTTIGNGPSFPIFRAYNSTTKEEVKTEEMVFIFFLKKRPDSRYSPVTGNDNAIYSVARIDGVAFAPLPSRR